MTYYVSSGTLNLAQLNSTVNSATDLLTERSIRTVIHEVIVPRHSSNKCVMFFISHHQTNNTNFISYILKQS